MQPETTLARLSLRDHLAERNVSMISEQAKQRMRDLATRYPIARSAVMPALYIAQQEEGYITQQALEAVAETIGLTVDDVESVATFYTMYYQRPPGKKVIKVCTSISCYLRGCDTLVSHLEKRLSIKRGETSADGNYTFMTAECLASCGTAPVLQVNNEFVENVTLEMVDALVDQWNKELGIVSDTNAPDSSRSDGQDGNIKDAGPKSKIRL